MALTLNQIQSRIKALAESHDQINFYFFGGLPDAESQQEIDYPACYVEFNGGAIDRAQKAYKYSFRAYFVDLTPPANNAQENETEVLSDMFSVAGDFIAMLNYSEYQDDWWIDEVVPAQQVTEGLADFVAGCYIDFTVNTEYITDRCQVPATDVTFENDFEMARTRILTYTGGDSLDSSFTVTNLSGKIVLAVYRAGQYKRAITTTPTDSDKVKVTGTDLGDRKGILSTDGTVALASGDALINGEIIDFLIWE